MPLPRDPTIPEFFVYRLETGGVPFYVGVGRAGRASDRVRYVRYMMSREARGLDVRWNLSAEVVAALLRDGRSVDVVYGIQHVPRAAALQHETAEIRRLLDAGFVLANQQQNPNRPKRASEVVRAVVQRTTR